MHVITVQFLMTERNELLVFLYIIKYIFKSCPLKLSSYFLKCIFDKALSRSY